METLDQTPKPKLDLDAVRERLSKAKGRQYWRGLEEIAETPEFQDWMDDEFPNRESLKGLDRRTMLKYMGASLALAGLSGCRGLFLPQKKVVPYVHAPEEMVYGKPLFYATIFSQGGYAKGVLVEQHDGRPSKIEGNPDHPATLGACDSFMQASILHLYDPDRAQNVTQAGETSTWETFFATVRERLANAQAVNGSGIRLLTENVTSPSFAAEIRKFLKAYPGSQWHQWEPTSQDNLTQGAIQAFGKPINTVYDFKPAKVVLSLDSEFMMSMPGSLRYSRDFADGRRIRDNKGTMNRLYAFESMPTITGAYADHRWAVRASDVETIARAIAAGVGIAGAAPSGKLPVQQSVIDAIVKDLRANPGATIVVAGQHQPAIVHQLAHHINNALGNVGRTVTYTTPVEAEPVVHQNSLKALVDDMNAGRVQALFILGTNPVYTAPSDFKFAEALSKVPFKAQHSAYLDETGALCEWHLPEAHFLEAWSDGRAYDGTISIQQPIIEPLFEGRTHAEMLSALRGETTASYDLVQAQYKKGSDKAFDKEWRRYLHQGVVPNSALPAQSVSLIGNVAPQKPVPAGNEIIFQLDPTIYDGRYANNGWLQELPKPLTKVTWDSVIHMSPRTAKKLGGIANEDTVELSYGGKT
ncbi:MAG: hypothetical protein QOJ65_1536, partial [Fimbriimonadaceae bacterium]|nr:hypothetical protein [Fimbriimonadaceae bacterium]